MLLRGGQLETTGRETGSLTTADYQVRWHGLVYLKGRAAGLPSLQTFAEAAKTNLAAAAAELKGVFFVAVKHLESGDCYAFVDNSALFHAYYSLRFVSTSFIELARLEELRPENLDDESLVELFHFGTISFGRTLFSNIRKIDPDVIVCIKAGGTATLIPKPLPDIAAAPDQPFEEFLRDFACSVAGKSISLDLTGGIDSRLLAAALSYYGLPFELAASGVPRSRDLQIAEHVATVLGRNFVPTYHNPDGADWEEILAVCEGMCDPAKAHRPIQLQQDRQRRGIEVALSGAGGELFKDFWWLQDFPLYRRRRSSLQRLYAFRLVAIEPQHSYLARRYRAVSKTYRSRTLLRLSRYIAETNTQTYDRIYYFFKMREFAGRFLTNSLQYLEVYAPYLERDAVRVGYGLSRGQRFFNRYHRELITRFHPGAAGIPTTEGGMSVSSKPRDLSVDLARYMADRCKRLARKAGQRVLSKSYFQESANHPHLAACLRELVVTRRSVERLQEEGILRRSLQATTVRPGYLGTILALDWLLEMLEQAPVCSASQEREKTMG
jgi:Asparagine synthase